MTIFQKNRKDLYPILVRRYIAEKYSVEDELAILNNYASEPSKYQAEYAEYQTYRATCKQRAKTELGIE